MSLLVLCFNVYYPDIMEATNLLHGSGILELILDRS